MCLEPNVLRKASYSIKNGDAVSINENHVKVLKSGEVTFKATKAETNEYEAATAMLNLVIDKAPQFIAFEDTTTTSIIYGNAFSNKANVVENTSVPDKKGYAPLTEITYSVDEGADIVSVDNNGNLTFKNNAPVDLSISYSKPVMGAILEGLTFGFYQADVTVTIKGTDETSHIASFEYTYGDQNETIESGEMESSNEDKTAQASLTISPHITDFRLNCSLLIKQILYSVSPTTTTALKTVITTRRRELRL